MPQMAPLKWLVLFFYFTFIFLLFNIMNYYNFIYQVKKKTFKKKEKKINWKW